MVSFKEENIAEKNEGIANFSEILRYDKKSNNKLMKNSWIIPEEKTWHVGMEEMSAKSRMGKYLVEFASNSSIHGFNHLVARHRHPLERFLAAVLIVFGFACFLYVSIISWYQYQNDGFIILQDNQRGLMRVMKPALVICPTRVIEDSNFPTTFKRYGLKDTPQARTFFHLLSNASYDNMEKLPDYKDAPAELWLNILNDLKRDFYYETSLLGDGTWIITEQGVCFSIGNYVTPYVGLEYLINQNWTTLPLPMYPPEISDYLMEDKEVHNPNYLPSFTYQANHPLTETLMLDVEAEIHPIDPLEGFKLMDVTMPVKNNGTVDHSIRIGFEISAKGIEKESVHRRGCKFPLDKGLKLYPIYSYQMCITEYRADIIKKDCGCYPHFVRRVPGVPVCNVTQLHCAGKHPKIKKTIHSVDKKIDNCFFNCNKARYFVAIRLVNIGPVNVTNITIVIKFPTNKHVRKQKVSFVDFMTNVGSAAGLFLGCSVLSFVEIFYYGTLHLWIYKQKYKQK